MAGPGRPKKETSVDALANRKVTQARFHLGVQLNAGVYTSLDVEHFKKKVRKELEMLSLPNNRLYVRIENEEWLIPDTVIHSLKLAPLEKVLEQVA